MEKFKISGFESSKINANLVGYTTNNLINGWFEFSDLTLLGEPMKTYFFVFSSKSMTDKLFYNYQKNLLPNEIILTNNESSLFTYFFFIPISLRNCSSGEILVNSSTMSTNLYQFFVYFFLILECIAKNVREENLHSQFIQSNVKHVRLKKPSVKMEF